MPQRLIMMGSKGVEEFLAFDAFVFPHGPQDGIQRSDAKVLLWAARSADPAFGSAVRRLEKLPLSAFTLIVVSRLRRLVLSSLFFFPTRRAETALRAAPAGG